MAGPTNSFATPASGIPGLCGPGLGTPVSGLPALYSGRFPAFPFGGLRPPLPPEDDNVKVFLYFQYVFIIIDRVFHFLY